MGNPQKGKGHKRRKQWHRGRGEAQRWQLLRLPDVGSGADPTSGGPEPVHRSRRSGNSHRGDAL